MKKIFFLIFILILKLNTNYGIFIKEEINNGKIDLIPEYGQSFKNYIEEYLNNNTIHNSWIYIDKFQSSSFKFSEGYFNEFIFTAVKTECMKEELSKDKEKCLELEKQDDCKVVLYLAPLKYVSWNEVPKKITKVNCLGLLIPNENKVE